MADSPVWLAALAERARAALAAELATEGSPGSAELANRARDYRSWRLMRAWPARVEELAHTLLSQLGPSVPQADAEEFRALCLALTELLAELCEQGHAAQSGQ